MVKFLKLNKAVIILQGRFAGRKAMIVKNFDEGMRDRAYAHCLVTGSSKYPKKVIQKDSAKKSWVKTFLKVVNYSHIMLMRYTLDVDLKDVVSLDALQTQDKKILACKETKKHFEEHFKAEKIAGSSPSSVISFLDLHSETGLRTLEDYLSGKTFISGDMISKDDIRVFGTMTQKPGEGFSNFARWYDSVCSVLSARYNGSILISANLSGDNVLLRPSSSTSKV